MDNMFCFQCEQTAKGTGCTIKGVCGKDREISDLQDQLTGALIALSRAVHCNGRSELADHLMMEGLFTCITNVNFNSETLNILINKVDDEKWRLIGRKDVTCVGAQNYDMMKIWTSEEDIRSLKSLILFGNRGMAAYAYHADILGYSDDLILDFFFKSMRLLGDTNDADELFSAVLELGQVNYKCMELLDKANTESFGNPSPVEVTMEIEKGPFIIVTGHDLNDIKEICIQAEKRGVNVYTHGEMLPSHAYPELKKFKNLKGNFGTAWHNQQKEFKAVPAAVVYTTNCLMPPKKSYIDRVYTTEVVSYPGIEHISDGDYTKVIDKAIELGGYKENTTLKGINGGTKVTTGFGHKFVLDNAGTIVEAVNKGDISHFFLVGGCDGANGNRSYFTDFVKESPKDSIILTLACGKFRFNDLDLGEIDGLPRIMDMGQCNDAYSAIQVAIALSEAFKCDINDLPLSMIISWYEQKAVCILLTLLSLGIKNIILGPTLPAFISPNVLAKLVEVYNIAPTTTVEADLAKCLNK